MESSIRQRSYLASLIKERLEYPTLKAIWNATPKNNEKYPNEVADYREMILADNLSPLSGEEISYIITALLGGKIGHHRAKKTTAFKYLVNLKLV